MKKALTLLIALFLCATFNVIYSQEAKEKEGKVTKLTKAEFTKKVIDYTAKAEDRKYLGDKPAIVDFYADWCGPCRRLSPILEEIAAEQKGKIIIYKVNVDDERDIATAFGIRSLPTLFFISADGTINGIEGYLPKEELYKIINNYLLKEDSKK